MFQSVVSAIEKNRTAAIGITAVVAVAYTAFAWNYFNSVSSDPDVLPALTEEETVEIMSKIAEKFKYASIQVSQYVSQIVQQYRAQGLDIEEEAMMKNFLPQAEKLFHESEAKVYEDFDVDESDVESAVNIYVKQGNSELKSIVKKIRDMYKALGGEAEEEIESDSKGPASKKPDSKKKSATNAKKTVSRKSAAKTNVIADEDDKANEAVEILDDNVEVERENSTYKVITPDTLDVATSTPSSSSYSASKKKQQRVVEVEDVAEDSDNEGSSVSSSNSGECAINTVEELIAFVDTMAERMMMYFEAYYNAFTKDHGKLSMKSTSEVKQRFQLGLLTLVQEIQSGYFAACGMTEQHFQKLVTKHKDNEELQMAWMRLQYGTQIALQQKLENDAGGSSSKYYDAGEEIDEEDEDHSVEEVEDNEDSSSSNLAELE